MTEKEMSLHVPPMEYIRDSNGILVEYEVWRKAHPLTPEQIEANRRGFVQDVRLDGIGFLGGIAAGGSTE